MLAALTKQSQISPLRPYLYLLSIYALVPQRRYRLYIWGQRACAVFDHAAQAPAASSHTASYANIPGAQQHGRNPVAAGKDACLVSSRVLSDLCRTCQARAAGPPLTLTRPLHPLPMPAPAAACPGGHRHCWLLRGSAILSSGWAHGGPASQLCADAAGAGARRLTSSSLAGLTTP